MDVRSVLVLVCVSSAVVAVALFAFRGSPRTPAVVTPTFSSAAATAPGTVVTEPSAGPESQPPGTVASVVVVDVAGLVAQPGVYDLPVGSRVIDAVEAAGGAISGTDLSQLNLARLLVDGEQIAVGVAAAPAPPAAMGSGPASVGPATPIDLNAATESDLDGLPGVGPVLAARIVAWRTENGQFSSIDELMEVSGIGEATFADLEPLVRV